MTIAGWPAPGQSRRKLDWFRGSFSHVQPCARMPSEGLRGRPLASGPQRASMDGIQGMQSSIGIMPIRRVPTRARPCGLVIVLIPSTQGSALIDRVARTPNNILCSTLHKTSSLKMFSAFQENQHHVQHRLPLCRCNKQCMQMHAVLHLCDHQHRCLCHVSAGIFEAPNGPLFCKIYWFLQLI